MEKAANAGCGTW